MRWVRAVIYRLGFRPRLGSIFYSPTLHLRAAMRTFSEDFRRGLENFRNEMPL